jgi:hypothetical protein
MFRARNPAPVKGRGELSKPGSSDNNTTIAATLAFATRHDDLERSHE